MRKCLSALAVAMTFIAMTATRSSAKAEDPVTTRKFESVLRVLEAQDRRFQEAERRIAALERYQGSSVSARQERPPAQVDNGAGCGCGCDCCKPQAKVTPTSLGRSSLGAPEKWSKGFVVQKAVLRP